MSGQELAEAYASADVFAFPSDTETLGFVAMEAMASGVPVVGARAGGIPDVIREGETGTMFTPGNLKELTDKLRELLFDEAKRRAFGIAARKEMERYSWRASTEKLVEYYKLAQTIHRRYDPPSRY